MKKLTELAIKRPLLIVVAFLVLIFFGLFSYNKLNYNLLPKMDFPVVSIVTTYRGASAQEIENNVTKNIEDGVSSMEGIKKITSQSLEGASVVVVQFNDNINASDAQTDAQRKINQVMSLLPDDIDEPIINKFSSDDIPVLRMSATANESDADLYDLVDQQIKPQLANIKGVGQVALIGGSERQINVKVSQEKLDYYGLSILEVNQVVSLASLSTPAGKIQNRENEFAIEFDSKFRSASQLQHLIIRQLPGGGKIYLKDVATISDGQKEASTINHINGVPAIGIQIQKQTDANAVEVTQMVKERLASLEKQHHNIDLHFEIASDQSTYTLQSANAVMEDLMLAILIVSVVMLFFLHSMRNALFVLVALPSSIIPTFISMYLFGMSLNLMTLMALSLVVGILVDDSIVILENIMRHLEMGKNKIKATVDGRYEIGFTAIAITSVDLVVFLPMSLVSGIIGNIIREFSLTVVFSTFMSLVVAFTLTPLLSSRWGRLTDLSKDNLWTKMNRSFERMITRAREGYTKILKWALFHKRWIFGSTLILLLGSFALPYFGFIGSTFVATGDQGEVILQIELDPTASIYQTNEVTQKAERLIMNFPQVKTVFTNVGISSNGIQGANNSNLAEINIKMVDKQHRSLSDIELGEKMRQEVSQIPGVKATMASVSLVGGADEAPVQLVIKGTDREVVREAANKVMDIVSHTPGVVYPKFSTKKPRPQIDVKLDRTKMALFGLDAGTVGSALGISFRGNDQTKYNHGGKEYSIMVQNDDFDKAKIGDIKNLVFINQQGQRFTLGQFAEVKETLGEAILERNDRLASITVEGYVQGRSAGTVGSEVGEKMKSLELPPGVSWNFTGQMENQQDAFGSLFAALGIGILLVYLIMVALYENAVYPFVVMMAMPLAIIGALLALALTMNELTVFTIIGMIMLIGLVTKNGILLVDFTNQRKAEGANLVEALVDAGRERFRPILMTTVAMIAGMMPMALSTSYGAEVKSGMAWVLIGGLTSSLVMTLVVVPCFYYIVEQFLNLFRKRRRRRLEGMVKERRRRELTEVSQS